MAETTVPWRRWAGLAAMLLASTTNAAAADKPAPRVQRVLHVCDCPAAMAGDERTELLTAFAKLSYVQGRNLDLVTYDLAVGQDSYAAFIAREVARSKPALILASGVHVALGAKQANVNTPVVFWRLTDPVGLGLVASLARPQGRLTGFSRAIEKLTAKRLELMHEMIPKAQRFAFVFISDDASNQRQAAEVHASASALGLQVMDYTLPESEWSAPQLDGLFARMRQDGIDAFLLPDLITRPTLLVALAARYRLPTIHSLTHVVTDWGGLAAYSTAPWQGMDEVVGYADRILRGARPDELPVQEPTRYELVLNERAARDVGLSFPPLFMLRATQVVSREQGAPAALAEPEVRR